MPKWTVHHGDCLEVMRTLAESSIDAVVTDPPYHLTTGKRGGSGPASICLDTPAGRARIGTGFMGKAWDGGDIAHRPEVWAEALRLCKPGAHLLAFGGTRTYHRLVCAVEDAGWEIRDQIGWAFGSGFPKSLNLDGQWDGWGTALKPAYEPVILAQKPYTPQQSLAILIPTIGDLICKAVSSEKTDMPLCGLLRESGFWSTGTSLNKYLAALSGRESRCTTETANALTTDLRILKSSLLRITRAITIGAPILTSGDESDASLAVAISRSVLAKCERLTNTTAGEIAIDWPAEEGSAPAGGKISPAWEPIVLARKPLVGTVAANVEKHGTGALNIDGCRVPTDESLQGSTVRNDMRGGRFAAGHKPNPGDIEAYEQNTRGRWPANLIHDGSPEVLACFPQTASGKMRPTHTTAGAGRAIYGQDAEAGYVTMETYGDAGSAARFFYVPKADREDRNVGLEGRSEQPLNWSSGDKNPGSFQSANTKRSAQNHHPTVKPTDLMRYLCRLITPPGGTVLDPFTGSGSTGRGALLEGFGFVGIEREAEYVEIARLRIAEASGLFSQETA